MSYVVSGVGNKGRRLLVAVHPSGKKERLKFTRRLKQAYKFASRHTAQNIRDDMLKTFSNVTISRV